MFALVLLEVVPLLVLLPATRKLAAVYTRLPENGVKISMCTSSQTEATERATMHRWNANNVTSHHAPIVLEPVQLFSSAMPLSLGLVAGKVGPELLGPGVSLLAVLADVGLLALVHHLQVAEEVVDPVDVQAAALLRTLVLLDGHVVKLDVSDDERALDVLLAFGAPGVVAARLDS